ncbi:coproporphyrinogen III oxidase [Candidatus Pelagibacter sp.]|nr:coproporphyrinogen III oxidase [Candidatus Pelagibacter sp.]
MFDKVGVNFSEVYGKFSNEFKNKVPGTKTSSKFWASGISVVMHMKNPHVPAMHFNTRYIVTSFGWFGGGMDVTPSSLLLLLFQLVILNLVFLPSFSSISLQSTSCKVLNQFFANFFFMY